MKKKLLTLVLALTMVLSMSMTAMAATKTETETFNKKYNTNAVGVYPTETLSFIVEGNGQGKPIVAVADKEITGNGELQ